MIKKLIAIFALFLIGGAAFASPEEEVTAFFNKYVSAANSYSESLPSFYAPNAKIIRVVIKKDGTRESVVSDTATYMKQLKLSAKLAKVRNYKNYYTNRTVVKVGNNYKLTCKRQPSTSDYKLNAHFVIGKDAAGAYKIKEESMETYQTAILTKAKEQGK